MSVEIVPFPYRVNVKKERRRKIIAAVAAGIFIVLWSVCVYSEMAFREISDNVLRLHVLANSDSQQDQALKLKVRDCVLEETNLILQDCANRTEAESRIASNMKRLSQVAVQCVAEEGYDYPVTVRMEDIYFPTRTYEGGSLPAGVYKALRVEIGKAEGQNWWCVLFPQLCFINASVPDKPSPTQEPAPTREPVSVQTQSVTLRFKLIDIFQKTKHEIKSIWTWFAG